LQRFLPVCAVLLLFAAEARADGVIRGTLWTSRADARRAEMAREAERAARTRTSGHFDFLGTPALRRTPATPRVAPAEAKPGVKAPVARPQPGMTDAVISIRTIPPAAEQRLARQMQRDRRRPNPRIVIRQSRFAPRVMAVAAGTDIEVQNLDRIWHSTFSVSSAGRFDLGKIRPGAIDTVQLARAGTINLHCDIHPDETGFVVVAPNHAYARPDAMGRFSLPRLPAGRYQLQLWHPQRGVRERTIEIPRRGDVACDLAF